MESFEMYDLTNKQLLAAAKDAEPALFWLAEAVREGKTDAVEDLLKSAQATAAQLKAAIAQAEGQEV
jgi:hypothetical protein